jgi:hypothetical protein
MNFIIKTLLQVFGILFALIFITQISVFFSFNLQVIYFYILWFLAVFIFYKILPSSFLL